MASHLSLRPYQDSDRESLCAIHDRARLDELRGSCDLDAFVPLHRAGESEGLWECAITVATIEGCVRGFVATDNDYIAWLYVDPDDYRRGVGRALLRHAVAECGPNAQLTTLVHNAPALRLYESEGFRTLRRGSGPIGDYDVEWLRMTRAPDAQSEG